MNAKMKKLESGTGKAPEMRGEKLHFSPAQLADEKTSLKGFDLKELVDTLREIKARINEH